MRRTLSLVGALCALIALLFSSPLVLERARYGLTLCAQLILPSLFPFFVLSLLLTKLGFPQLLARFSSGAARRLFGVSGEGLAALLVGLCGGYPLGAACIAEQLRAGTIGREEAEHLLGFCNNSGPAFLVGALGAGIFSSPAAGLLLYGAHIAAALLSGLLTRTSSNDLHNSVDISSFSMFYVAFPAAVKESVSAVLTVCGFVVCFSVLTGMLDARGSLGAAAAGLSALSGWDERVFRALLTGFFELGSGVGELRGLSPTPGHLALASALVGWGGLSVHCQTAAVLSDCELSLKTHLCARLLSAGLSALLSFGCALLLRLAFPALL